MAVKNQDVRSHSGSLSIFVVGKVAEACGQNVSAHAHASAKTCDASTDACARRTPFSHAEGQQRPQKSETTASDRDAGGQN